MKKRDAVLALAVLCVGIASRRALAINTKPIFGDPPEVVGDSGEHPVTGVVRAINAVPGLGVSLNARVIDIPSRAVGVQLQMPQEDLSAHEAVIARLKSEVPGFANAVPGEAYVEEGGGLVNRNFWLYGGPDAPLPQRELGVIRGIRTAEDDMFGVREGAVKAINEGVWMRQSWAILAHLVEFDGVSAREIRSVPTDGRPAGLGVQLSAKNADQLKSAETKMLRLAHDPLRSFEEGETVREELSPYESVTRRNYWLTRP